MKFKVLALLCAIAASLGIAAPAYASPATITGLSPYSVGSAGTPWFGVWWDEGTVHYDTTDMVHFTNSTYEVNVTTTAGSPSSHWNGGGVHTPAGWLKAQAVLQYDDNGDGVSDGNCGSTQLPNLDAEASIDVDIVYSLIDCPHGEVRGWARHSWRPDGGAWQEKIFYTAQGWFSNWSYLCKAPASC